jgi:hypothetical protein
MGTLRAGNTTVSYNKELIIKINGNINNQPLNVDISEEGNKMIVVTGLLSLYGNPPQTVWTRLV